MLKFALIPLSLDPSIRQSTFGLEVTQNCFPMAMHVWSIGQWTVCQVFFFKSKYLRYQYFPNLVQSWEKKNNFFACLKTEPKKQEGGGFLIQIQTFCGTFIGLSLDIFQMVSLTNPPNFNSTTRQNPSILNHPTWHCHTFVKIIMF